MRLPIHATRKITNMRGKLNSMWFSSKRLGRFLIGTTDRIFILKVNLNSKRIKNRSSDSQNFLKTKVWNKLVECSINQKKNCNSWKFFLVFKIKVNRCFWLWICLIVKMQTHENHILIVSLCSYLKCYFATF